MKNDQHKKVQEALARKWHLTLPNDRSEEDDPQQMLLQALKERVLHLLHHNYSKLVDILYRLDVPEHESNAAFALQKPEAIAGALSEAILKREMQKMASRRQHRQENRPENLTASPKYFGSEKT